jgi:two-component sensor histidine kinase
MCRALARAPVDFSTETRVAARRIAAASRVRGLAAGWTRGPANRGSAPLRLRRSPIAIGSTGVARDACERQVLLENRRMPVRVRAGTSCRRPCRRSLRAICRSLHRSRTSRNTDAARLIISLVDGDTGVHAGRSDMSRSLGTRLRKLAIIAGVWTIVSMFSALSISLRESSGELTPGPRWIWVTLAVIPLWTFATPPILALSRRFPFERRTLGAAVPVHALALLAILALDGLVNLLIGTGNSGRELTYVQHVWRYSFINAFFYAGVVAVEHAGHYYRLYLDRRVHASELEAQVSRAQLQALQMQIRPHFLFNTLNTISGLVRIDDKAAATTMLAGLGDLLRLLLRSDGAQEVPVWQELELIERYLQIERVRFGDRLAIEVSVEPGVEDALVPNLILQPLVENAVRHGIRTAAGRVAVTVARVGQALRMEVFDSGEARPHDGDGDGAGIGLTNTRARLERLYGGVHRFELARGDAGTSAIIEIPLHRDREVEA